MSDQDTADYFEALDATPPLKGSFSSAASGISSDVQAMLDAPSPADEALRQSQSSESNFKLLETLTGQGFFDEDGLNKKFTETLKEDNSHMLPDSMRLAPKSKGPGL